ncbi:MAG: cytochrome C oxidase subunit IV family protein [Pseudomonadota bacterium]
MAEAHAPSGVEAAHGGGHASLRTYVQVAMVLAIITAIEVATLYVPGIPKEMLVASLLIMSIIKFVLVVGFFMHLKYDSPIMRAVFVAPLVLSILIILALMALFGAYLLLPRPTL